MRIRSYSAVSIYLLAFCLSGAAQSTPKPKLTVEPLTSEQISIYRAFIADYDNGSKYILNMAQTTDTFEADSGDLAGCMKTFNKTNSRAMAAHSFPSDAFPTDKVHLVDPGKHEISDPGNAIGEGQSVDDAVEAGFKAGLFTFSEVVFDTAHTHAALNYTFHCGSLCGHGGTVVFIKARGIWKRSKANCGSWIS
jgi:hypothetical protein